MRLTPLGKTLFFLIGLGLIATAIYRFVPPDRLPWNRPAATRTEPARTTPPPAATATAAKPSASLPRATAAGPWIEIPGGLFASGREQTPVDVPTFRLQRTEVTNREYEAFLADCPAGSSCGPRELPSYWDDRGYLQTHADLPVVFVTWGEAAAFCKWFGGRLPSATEWEKAARGSDGRSFPTGATLDPSDVNILGEHHELKSRAAKQIPTWATSDPRYDRDASPYGILAMSGNVSEWTASTSEDEPDLRLAAGGSWDSWELSDGRADHRLAKNPTDRSSSVGFRCAQSR